MEKKYDITLVGMMNLNLALCPVDKSIFDSDVTLIGPIVGTPGGDAMNEAITAARLGNRVALLSITGDDIFGRAVLAEAEATGIYTGSIRVRKNTPSAVGAMLIDAAGDRNICAYRGALEEFCLEDIDFEIIESSRYVNIGSIFALKSLDGAGVAELLRRAKSAGAITSADVKQDVYNIGFEKVKQVFPHLDYFLPSIDEARYMSGEDTPEKQADFFMRAGCANVAVKLGRDGCFIANKNIQAYLPPCPAKRVDTSGAGDNFVGGLLTGLAKGWSFEEAARFANATAAISVQQYGSNGAVTSFEQVQNYRREKNY